MLDDTTQTLTTNKNYNITIDLNGKRLESAYDRVILHKGTGMLSINDSSIGKGVIKGIAVHVYYLSLWGSLTLKKE